MATNHFAARFRTAVAALTPAGATVAVVSKGDADLVSLPGRTGWHVPRQADGVWAGYTPADAGAAVAHIEALKTAGADYLVFPPTTVWWLEFYPQLKHHLERNYRTHSNDHVGQIYSFHQPAAASFSTHLATVVSSLARASRDIAVLDWQSGLDCGGATGDYAVFTPPEASASTLPYLDATVNVVVIRNATARQLAEARRVARDAVISVSDADDIPAEQRCRVEVTSRVASPAASIFAIVPLGGAERQPNQSELRSRLAATGLHDLQIISARNARTRSRGPRQPAPLRQVDLAACNRAAARATGEKLLILPPTISPIGDCWEAMANVFETHADAGAVCGRLASYEGRLWGAGGRVFSGGAILAVGHGEYRMDAPVFAFLRECDVCVAGWMMTSRKAFVKAGGFDVRFTGLNAAIADYCYRLRQTGARVYYEPGALAVDSRIIAATSHHDDLASADRRHLAAKHRAALKGLAKAPVRIDASMWYSMVHAPGQEVHA